MSKLRRQVSTHIPNVAETKNLLDLKNKPGNLSATIALATYYPCFSSPAHECQCRTSNARTFKPNKYLLCAIVYYRLGELKLFNVDLT